MDHLLPFPFTRTMRAISTEARASAEDLPLPFVSMLIAVATRTLLWLRTLEQTTFIAGTVSLLRSREIPSASHQPPLARFPWDCLPQPQAAAFSLSSPKERPETIGRVSDGA